MPWLVDGSNVLGAMRVDRHAEAGKRELVRLLAAFGRARKTRITCIFDGPEPASFGRHLGHVTVAFSEGRPADDLIAERAAKAHGWIVVTSDRALAARVQRRGTQVMTSPELLRAIESATVEEPDVEADWTAYFSDPKNRSGF